MSETNLNDEIETIEEAKFRLESKKWNVRRDMAYKSMYLLFFIIFFVLLMVALGRPLEGLEAISGIIMAAIGGLVSIVAFYFGTTTWYDIKK